MRITVHIDMEEIDYIAIVQAAQFKRKSTEDFIREAIKEAVEKVMIDMRLQQTQPPTQQFQGAKGEVQESKAEEKK